MPRREPGAPRRANAGFACRRGHCPPNTEALAVGHPGGGTGIYPDSRRPAPCARGSVRGIESSYRGFMQQTSARRVPAIRESLMVGSEDGWCPAAERAAAVAAHNGANTHRNEV